MDLAARFKPDSVAVESNQFQVLLADEFARQSKLRGIMLPVMPMMNLENKLVRIRTLTPYLSRHEFRFMRGSPASPGTALLLDQLKRFPACRNDDGPDALEMALRRMREIFDGVVAMGSGVEDLTNFGPSRVYT